MAERFKYGLRYKYPHMKPADVLIWERFMQKFPTAYDEVEYDVLVGTATPAPEETPENLKKDWEVLGKKKIDVVGFKVEGIDILELKPQAGASALGQVRGYADLYEAESGTALPVRPVLITDILKPDMEFLARKQGVKLIIV